MTAYCKPCGTKIEPALPGSGIWVGINIKVGASICLDSDNGRHVPITWEHDAAELLQIGMEEDEKMLLDHREGNHPWGNHPGCEWCENDHQAFLVTMFRNR